MNGEIKELMDRYLEWLRDRTLLRQVQDWTEITTPFLDRHNDYVQIYARREGEHFILTDDGYTLNDLEQSGCRIDTPKREALLHMTLKGFGVQLQGGRELQVRAFVENFPIRKHSLIQAILAVNDLFYLASPVVASLFYEDVVAWLDLNEIRYTPRVKFTGKTGYDHLFDFVIPKSRKQPERIVQAVNRPTRESAESLVFAWADTKEVRSPDSRAYAFLNDSEQAVPVAVLEALRSYDVSPVPWTQRDSVRLELAA